MKKLIIVFVILFIANLSCKKDEDGGGDIPNCGCSSPQYPYLNLVIKSSSGDDLLNANNSGSFSNGQIQFYYKEANGSIRDIIYTIKSPFSYGNTGEKFIYYQLYSTDIVTIAKTSSAIFYLKLGNTTYELSLELDQQPVVTVVSKLLIDKKEATKETGSIKNYLAGNIFYLVM
jgi:hypothetical protein